MKLTFRQAAPDDFEAFYIQCFRTFGESDALRAKVRREWDVLISHPLTHSMVVEGRLGGGKPEMLAYGMAVFVSERFVTWARTGMTPYLNAHIIEPMDDGSNALCSEDEQRRMNGFGGVNAYIAHWGWRHDLPDGIRYNANSYLHEKFWEEYRGYRIKTLMVEVVGEVYRDIALKTGLQLWRDYEDYYETNPVEKPYEQHCYLLGATPADAPAVEHTQIARVLAFAEPQFGFTSQQKRILRLALGGKSDEQIGAALHLSLNTVKNTVVNACNRAEAVDDELMPESPEGVRGRERRRELLRYLADHPEELRPTEK
jgi:DNA-binding CsgD family transcriptional regulator